MVATSQAEREREHIYIVLRREIVSGKIAPDQVVSSPELNERFGCAGKVAQEVLGALASDGYLQKTSINFLPVQWPNEEVRDLLKQLMLFHEITAFRVLSDQARLVDELARHRAEFELATTSDGQFVAALAWLRSMMTPGGRRTVIELAANVVPPAIIRIVWAAIETSKDIGPAFLDVEVQIRTGDARGVRDAVSQFWSFVIGRYDAAANGTSDDLGAGGEFQLHEPTLSGRKPVFGRSERWSAELLRRAKDRPRFAQRLPVSPHST